MATYYVEDYEEVTGQKRDASTVTAKVVSAPETAAPETTTAETK